MGRGSGAVMRPGKHRVSSKWIVPGNSSKDSWSSRVMPAAASIMRVCQLMPPRRWVTYGVACAEWGLKSRDPILRPPPWAITAGGQ